MTERVASRYMTPNDAAGYTSYKVGTLANMRVTGGGPRYLKRGKKVLYVVEDLDAWMRADMRTSTSESPKAA